MRVCAGVCLYVQIFERRKDSASDIIDDINTWFQLRNRGNNSVNLKSWTAIIVQLNVLCRP